MTDDQINLLAAQLAAESSRRSAAERRLFDLFDNLGDMAYVKDLDGVYTYINDAGASLLGLTPREVVGQTDRELFEPVAAAEVVAQDRHVVATGELLVVRVERAFPEGVHELVTRKWPWRDDDGRVVGVVGITREVTEEGLVRREAAELAEGLAQLVDALPDVILVHSQGVIRHANPAAAALLGAGADLTGRSMREVLGEVEARRVDALAAGEARAGVEILVQRPGAAATILDVRDVPASWFGARVRLLVGRDTSERRRVEAQLASSERMATLGLLAGSIAHEIRNPLTFVLERLLALEAQATGAEREALADVRDAAVRIESIVRDVGGFAKRDDAEAPVADVDAVIDRALVLARARVQGAEILRVRGARRPARAGEQRLCQVVLNLVVNAVQAASTSPSARVWVTTGDTGDFVFMRVRDSGPGVAAPMAARIFDPLVTTKPPEEGTGLGLWLSQSLVDAAGGGLVLENPGEPGASFLLTLPASALPMPRRADSLPPGEHRAPQARRAAPGRAREQLGASSTPPSPQPPPPPSSSPPGAPRRPRLLVVDDEPMITDLVSMGVADAFEVVVANGVLAAEARLAEAPGFDLVLCDLLMPGGGGARVHAHVQGMGPSAPPMVFMSGCAADGGARRFLSDHAVTMVEKPFRLVDLRRRLLAAVRR